MSDSRINNFSFWFLTIKVWILLLVLFDHTPEQDFDAVPFLVQAGIEALEPDGQNTVFWPEPRTLKQLKKSKWTDGVRQWDTSLP